MLYEDLNAKTRLDGFSKEVRTLQINAPIMERALSAVIISQYRRKVAEKHKIAFKPVAMFKANRVTSPKEKAELRGNNPQIVVSGEFKIAFHNFISGLNENLLKSQKQIQNATLIFLKLKIKIFACLVCHFITKDKILLSCEKNLKKRLIKNY